MSDLLDESMAEPLAVRRKRLLEEGRAACVESARDILASHLAAVSEAFEAIVISSYRTGLDTMGDVLQPEVSGAEIGIPIPRVTNVLPETQVLAINGVIRLLVTARTEFALHRRFDGNVTLPRAEAVALSAVVEAALGLDTSKLLEGDLFETRP